MKRSINFLEQTITLKPQNLKKKCKKSPLFKMKYALETDIKKLIKMAKIWTLY